MRLYRMLAALPSLLGHLGLAFAADKGRRDLPMRPPPGSHLANIANCELYFLKNTVGQPTLRAFCFQEGLEFAQKSDIVLDEYIGFDAHGEFNWKVHGNFRERCRDCHIMGDTEHPTDEPVIRGILECECDGRLMTIDLKEKIRAAPKLQFWHDNVHMYMIQKSGQTTKWYEAYFNGTWEGDYGKVKDKDLRRVMREMKYGVPGN